MMIKKYIFTFILLFLGYTIYAQPVIEGDDDDYETAEMEYLESEDQGYDEKDNEVLDAEVESAVEIEMQNYVPKERHFEKDLSQKYNGPDFDYTETPTPPPPPKPVKTNRTWTPPQWMLTMFGDIGSFIFYFLLIIAALIVLYVILVSVFNMRIFGPKLSKAKAKDSYSQDWEENPEDIDENDFMALAQRAESEGNYRLAFRFLFLDLLQNLNIKSHIEWKKNKTNNEYTYEIKNDEIRKEYKDLARAFDFLWYGKIPIENGTYQSLKNEFNLINDQL